MIYCSKDWFHGKWLNQRLINCYLCDLFFCSKCEVNHNNVTNSYETRRFDCDVIFYRTDHWPSLAVHNLVAEYGNGRKQGIPRLLSTKMRMLSLWERDGSLNRVSLSRLFKKNNSAMRNHSTVISLSVADPVSVSLNFEQRQSYKDDLN